MYHNREDRNIDVLLGKTISKIDGLNNGGDTVIFTTSLGDKYKMYHESDCCEHVEIDDVNGDIEDLIGTAILLAEESTNTEDSMGRRLDDSFTWTFYKLATSKGYVDIRWLGTSNGYYSESVSFKKIYRWNEEYES